MRSGELVSIPELEDNILKIIKLLEIFSKYKPENIKITFEMALVDAVSYTTLTLPTKA